ncbi:MAG TPA: hypothetical protein PLR30_07355 [Saprospiraceae bacterium]|nr:hypothetical protein [Saprospiraceae bacterium]
MKKTFMLYIMACLTSIFLFASCEKNEPQMKADTILPITSRTVEDCDDCPIDNCCCVVEVLDPNDTYTFQLCGVYTGMFGSTCGPFTPGSPCGTVSGISTSITLSSAVPRAFFCIATGGSFRILKTMGNGVTLRISCNADETNPDWFPFNIGDTPLYYYVQDCDDLDGC